MNGRAVEPTSRTEEIAMDRGPIRHVWPGVVVALASSIAACAPGSAPAPSMGSTSAVSAAPSAHHASSPPSQVAIRPGEPWIVYQGGDGEPIHLVRPDGTDDHLLLGDQPPGDGQGHPRWSPDGSVVAFDVFTDQPAGPERVDVWLADPDARAPRPLLTCRQPCLQLAYPAWSPDGSSIAVIRYDLDADGSWGPSAIEVADAETGTRRVVAVTADGSSAYYTPRWSPDGTELVVVLETYRNASQDVVLSSRLATVPVSGGEPVLVTPPSMPARAPDWAPGARIVFTTADAVDEWTATPRLMALDPDDGTSQPFFPAEAGGPVRYEAIWTDRGERIMFGMVDPIGGGQVLASVAADASDARSLPVRLQTATGLQLTYANLRPTP